MGTGSWNEESPDPRFEVYGWHDTSGISGYVVCFPEMLEDGETENPLFETEMPNGDERSDFQSLFEAQEFVLEMAKCLDEGTPWREEQESPDDRFKLFRLKETYEVENGDKITSFKKHSDAVKFIVRAADQLDDVAA